MLQIGAKQAFLLGQLVSFKLPASALSSGSLMKDLTQVETRDILGQRPNSKHLLSSSSTEKRSSQSSCLAPIRFSVCGESNDFATKKMENIKRIKAKKKTKQYTLDINNQVLLSGESKTKIKWVFNRIVTLTPSNAIQNNHYSKLKKRQLRYFN